MKHIQKMDKVHQQIRMLCLFDYGKDVHTGYATVARNLVQQWKKVYGGRLRMDIVAINYFGDPYFESENVAVENAFYRSKDESGEFPQFIDEAHKYKNDEFGRPKFLKMLSENDYDIAFILNDIGIITPIAPAIMDCKKAKLAANRKLFKSIVYFPVDSHVFPKLIAGLQVFDRLVTYTQFGRNEVVACNPKLNPSIIPHGTNLTDFYPLSTAERIAFKKEYFGENAGKFIIGNINRNQPRKDIPTTIFGFMGFKEKNPDSLLYLHMHPKDPLGYDLRSVLQQTPLVEGKDVMFPPQDKENHGTSVEDLNKIYNSIDCYLTTNKGEGWGLSISEAMRCKTPVIAPLHTSIPELSDGGKNIWALEEFDMDCQVVDNIIRYKCVDFEVTERLQELSDMDARDVEKRVDNAYTYISSITWEKSARQFVNIINQLL